MVAFIKGLVAGLGGAVPNINDCIPDFEGAITDAQTGCSDLVQGISQFNPSECVSAVNDLIQMLSEVRSHLRCLLSSPSCGSIGVFLPVNCVDVSEHLLITSVGLQGS